jgi:hypothetical protein
MLSLIIFLCLATKKKISLIILCLFSLGICKLYIYIILIFLPFYLVLYRDAYDELTRIPLQDEMGDESSSFLMRFHEVTLFFIVIVCMRF